MEGEADAGVGEVQCLEEGGVEVGGAFDDEVELDRGGLPQWRVEAGGAVGGSFGGGDPFLDAVDFEGPGGEGGIPGFVVGDAEAEGDVVALHAGGWLAEGFGGDADGLDGDDASVAFEGLAGGDFCFAVDGLEDGWEGVEADHEAGEDADDGPGGDAADSALAVGGGVLEDEAAAGL